MCIPWCGNASASGGKLLSGYSHRVFSEQSERDDNDDDGDDGDDDDGGRPTTTTTNGDDGGRGGGGGGGGGGVVPFSSLVFCRSNPEGSLHCHKFSSSHLLSSSSSFYPPQPLYTLYFVGLYSIPQRYSLLLLYGVVVSTIMRIS